MAFSVGKEELSEPVPLLKKLSAEFLGTMLLVIFGCGAAAGQGNENSKTMVALGFGTAVMAIACFTGHVSGGHLNPAVTVGLLIGGQCPVVRALLYIVAQFIGAIVGAAILWACTPEEWGLGVNGPVPADVPEFGAMMLELLATMVLVLVVYGTAVDKTNNSAPMLPCLLIGLTVSLAHFLLMPYSGCGINPARSFATSLMKNQWKDHWVYWVGPFFGGPIGGALYTFWFKGEAFGDEKKEEPVEKDVEQGVDKKEKLDKETKEAGLKDRRLMTGKPKDSSKEEGKNDKEADKSKDNKESKSKIDNKDPNAKDEGKAKDTSKEETLQESTKEKPKDIKEEDNSKDSPKDAKNEGKGTKDEAKEKNIIDTNEKDTKGLTDRRLHEK